MAVGQKIVEHMGKIGRSAGGVRPVVGSYIVPRLVRGFCSAVKDGDDPVVGVQGAFGKGFQFFAHTVSDPLAFGPLGLGLFQLLPHLLCDSHNVTSSDILTDLRSLL